MKKVFLLTFLIPFSLSGQVMYDFESGIPDTWYMDAGNHWDIDSTGSISGRYSLHHSYDNLSAGCDVTGFSITDLRPEVGFTRWSFRIRYGCEPSSSNNWRIFLLSDKPPDEMVTGTPNGFFIGIKATGYDDTLRLWKTEENKITPVINSGINWQNDVGTEKAALIIAERTPSGVWTMAVSIEGGETINTETANDIGLYDGAWFGIMYNYTATRDRLLWIDDIRIEGVFIHDTLPPAVKECNIMGRNSVQLIFDEEVETGSLVPGNFLLNGISHPVDVKKINKNTILIGFGAHFLNKSENILVAGPVSDRSGNSVTGLKVSFVPVWAETCDVVISEIMADPVPSVMLPEREYIEITNVTDYKIGIKGWKLSGDDQVITLPDHFMEPGEILILCSESNIEFFDDFGKVLGLKQFPILTDGGKLLALTDDEGLLIHGLEYSGRWYGDKLKKEGGWSLEMIDTSCPFSGESDWRVSVSVTGGTPGKVNSVAAGNPDLYFKGVENLYPVDSATLIIKFTESVPDFAGKIIYTETGGNRVIDVVQNELLQREFILKFEEPFKRNQIYTFYLSEDVTDFEGNKAEKGSFDFGLTENPLKGSVVFNELLFNPLPGYPDYIELFNNSDDVVDASSLFIVSINDAGGDTSEIYRISEENRCILPGNFFTITTDRKMISQHYFFSGEENIFEASSLPPMPDNGGHLLLLDRQFTAIDEVQYSEKMHFPLLSVNEGVALEKVRPGIASTDRTAWHSASESSGWGTPGAPNSVFEEVQVKDDRIILSGTRISPDNDGFEDVLIIEINPTGPGNVITVSVYDENGIPVRRLTSNMLAGEKAVLVWDGTIADGSVAESGIYIILITLFNDHGKTGRWKKVCAVIR